MTVVLVRNWVELEAIRPELDELARCALEASPPSESWMLIPALQHLGTPDRTAVVLVRALTAANPDGPRVLCGVFPIEVSTRYGTFPIRTVRLWNHLYSLPPAPLLHAELAAEAVRAFLEWVADHYAGSSLVEFSDLRTEFAFFRVLMDVVREDRILHLFVGVGTRAMFRLRQNADVYLNAISTPKHRHEMRRQERRLSELGSLTYDQLHADGDPGLWVEQFISLEMKGWKGKGGTAFGCKASHRTYLQEIVAAAHAQGKLMALGLALDGKLIAMKLNFVDGAGGGTAFKIAYDETYQKYSPGVMLELENIRRLHVLPNLAWMDSLAASDHSLKNRVWVDRTTIVTLLAAPSGTFGRFVILVLPLMRWLKRRLLAGR